MPSCYRASSRVEWWVLWAMDLAWLLMSLPWLSALEYNGQGVTMDVLGVLAAGNGHSGFNRIFFERLARNTLQCAFWWATGWLCGWVLAHDATRRGAFGPLLFLRKAMGQASLAVLKIIAVLTLLCVWHPIVGQAQEALGPIANPLLRRSAIYGHRDAITGFNVPNVDADVSNDVPLYALLAGYNGTAAGASTGSSPGGVSPAYPMPPEFTYFRTPILRPKGKAPRRAITGPVGGQATARSLGLEAGPRDPAKKLPNLVFVIAEALELSLFDEGLYPGLFPNMSAISAASMTFRHMETPFGVTYSIAGEVAALCSILLALPFDGTESWQALTRSIERKPAFASGTACMFDVLAAAGYGIELHVAADATFNGLHNLGRDHGAHAYIDPRHMIPRWHAGFHDNLQVIAPGDHNGTAGPLWPLPQVSSPWTIEHFKNWWGVTDDLNFNVSARRIQQLKAARASEDPTKAQLPPSMMTVLPRRDSQGQLHDPPQPAPGAPFAVVTVTMDMHQPPKPSPTCYGTGRASYPPNSDNFMLQTAHCFDLLLAQYIRDVADDNTIVVVIGDHQNNEIDVKKASLDWNLAQHKELGVRLTGDTTRRPDGRLPDETSRVFAMIYGPGRITPGSITRRSTQMDFAPTLLDAMGLDVVALGMGRSLLRPQEPTLPEWAAARGIDFNLELQEWVYDETVRTGMWTNDTSTASMQCKACAIRTFQ